MNFPPVTYASWLALVEKELEGKSFEKTLVQQTPERVPVLPLYTEAPADLSRDPSTAAFRICLRHDAGASAEELALDVEEGADALWLPAGATLTPGTFLVLDVDAAQADALLSKIPAGTRFALNLDPIGRGTRSAAEFAAMAAAAKRTPAGSTAVMVSTLPYHEAGADAADELACALATGVRYLEALLDAGLTPDQAAAQVALQVSVGRDTFLELSKLRALRTCWRKLLTGAGAATSLRPLVHGVCSSRTLTVRDPWVNMLRVTTQVFAAALGGADLVTPNAFDQALGAPSRLGRRVARNTGLVLRDESFLGKVADPAGGAYTFETLTDGLAREAWKRFQAIERDGGIVKALESGALQARFDAAWKARLEQIAKRKIPVLGVSEFAHLDEKLPAAAPAIDASVRRDSVAFEELRLRAEALPQPPAATLVTLGSYAESRPRAGFAAGFLTTGGIRTRETTANEQARIAVLCGSDERYGLEAAERARALKAAGCERVLLAGRPGALEGALREAGVDGFIFVGCDVVATLSDLLPAELLEVRS